VGACIGKFVIDLGFRNIFNTKTTWSGSVLTSGWLFVLYHHNIGLARFEVETSLGVICASVRLIYYVRGSMICQCLSFFIPHFVVSAWRLRCTKHMDCNSDVVQ
jgi:hypothetical protein